jgi:hypothetical protein
MSGQLNNNKHLREPIETAWLVSNKYTTPMNLMEVPGLSAVCEREASRSRQLVGEASEKANQRPECVQRMCIPFLTEHK